ncbi:hypothetical protein SLS56_000913 [Neofusicoccum ribis]|uniref:Uncharacterized protein n=1 Tax=Neofusicoccum ribis TaxID=45134 RepID=A0ABR3TB90_9PEZI
MSLVEFTRFMNDAAALEKTLRLLQGIAQLSVSIFASVETDEAAQLVDISGALRKHFALGRRYFRIFKWIDCALVAADALRDNEAVVESEREGVLALLNVAKWSYLGMFLFTEAFTIIDAMGLRKSSWAPMFFVESMRFWFYSITCSIVLTCYQLYMNRGDIARLQAEIGAKSVTANGNGSTSIIEKDIASEKEPKEKPKPAKKKESIQDKKQALGKARKRRHVLLRQLVGASCDLLTPGAVVNYTPVSPAAVAITSIISSLISSQDIWRKVNTK